MTTPELEDTRAAETFDWLCLVSKPPTETPQAGPFYQGRRDGWIAALRGVTGPVAALRSALTAAQAEADSLRQQLQAARQANTIHGAAMERAEMDLEIARGQQRKGKGSA